MLLRNIIFARLLSPHNFSIALTFGIVLSFFEYLSGFGHELLMQRHHDGDKPEFQATMHTVMILRGILVTALVVLISPLIPHFLNLPTQTFNYALLAVVPLINGFAHLDPQRAHRHNNFKISAKIGITADLSSIVVALISISIWDNYWAFYVSFVFRHSISTLLSHCLASRRYHIAFKLPYLIALWQFGLPLILVGVLKYFGGEVDKALVARYSGLAQFTLYFLTIMVTANAANVISVGLSKIFIRRISTAPENSQNNTAFENGIISLYLVLPILFTVGVFGERIIQWVFGQQYVPIPYLFPAAIALVVCRHLSHWLNQVVVGCADTKLLLRADLVRIASLIVVLPLVINYGDVRLLALSFAFSEIVYLTALTQFTSRVIHALPATSLRLFSIALLGILYSLVVYWQINASTILTQTFCYLLGMLPLIVLFSYFSLTCRDETQKLINKALTFSSVKPPNS